MALFGAEKWLERGETFSVYFHMFSTLSPASRSATAGSGCAGRCRPPTSGSPRRPGSIALVLFTIGATTFDGAAEGTLAEPDPHGRGLVGRRRARPGGRAADLPTRSSWRSRIGFVAGLFWAGIYGMHTVRGERSTRELGQLFAHAFIPIALAYLVAHYFSLVVFSGAGAVHLPALRSARRRLRLLRHRIQRDRLRRHQRQRDLVRPGRAL